MKIIIIKIKKFENNLNFGPPFVFFQTGRCITIDQSIFEAQFIRRIIWIQLSLPIPPSFYNTFFGVHLLAFSDIGEWFRVS